MAENFILGALLPLVGASFTILVAFLIKGKQRIQYYIHRDQELLPPTTSGGNIHLEVNKQTAEDPRFFAIRIRFRGLLGKSLDPNRFVRDLLVDFGPDSTVHSTFVGEVGAGNLEPQVEPDGRFVRIKPLHFNNGDFFTLNTICSKPIDAPGVVGKLDHASIKQYNPTLRKWSFGLLALTSFFGGAVVAGMVSELTTGTLSAALLIGIMLGGIALAFFLFAITLADGFPIFGSDD